METRLSMIQDHARRIISLHLISNIASLVHIVNVHVYIQYHNENFFHATLVNSVQLFVSFQTLVSHLFLQHFLTPPAVVATRFFFTASITASYTRSNVVRKLYLVAKSFTATKFTVPKYLQTNSQSR